jgi:hypothetical protein
MEDFLYDLDTIQHIRQAIASTYSNNTDSEMYIECVHFIDEVEKELIAKMKKSQE